MTIRALRHDEPIPLGEPRRLKNGAGYIRLRWKVGPGEYVEAYEHRIVAGAGPGVQVHHINGVKDDNRPENLEVVDPAEHGRRHRTVDLDRAISLYEQGHSTPQVARILGCNPATVYRLLVRNGVKPRSIRESLIDPRIDMDEVRRLKAEGKSNAAIARHLGCSRWSIDWRVKELAA